MKIALCMIVKDDSELDDLIFAVSSAVKYVDSVHITANGKRIKGIKQFCNKNKFDFTFLKWRDDFSEQRNFNFSRAPEGTDYILWLDTDDELVGGENIKNLAKIMKAQGLDMSFLSYWYGCEFEPGSIPRFDTMVDIELDQMRERLIKPGSVVWKGRLHETPVDIRGKQAQYSSFRFDEKRNPIAVLHRRADRFTDTERLEQKMDRNQRILEKQLEDEDKQGERDPRTILYLMKVYTERNDPELWKKNLLLGKEYLDKSGWDQERNTCCLIMGQCLGKLGRHADAADMYHQANKEFPHNPLTYLMLAESYYELKKFREVKHYLQLATTLDFDGPKTAAANNIIQAKLLAAQLMVKYQFNAERDVRKAAKAAEKLMEIMPTPKNVENFHYLSDLSDLDKACEHVDKLAKYFDSINDQPSILKLLESLPDSIRLMQFSHKLYHKYSNPYKWKENEIAIIANFGGKSFEEWSPKSLETGIGGSETAVIKLSKEWARMGYKVVVYGDPGPQRGMHDGVQYVPWYYMNRNDSFNIVIQWRNSSWAGKLVCKKFFVDLHDVFHPIDFTGKEDAIDGVFVKSDYHKRIGTTVGNTSFPENKYIVISNGIDL